MLCPCFSLRLFYIRTKSERDLNVNCTIKNKLENVIYSEVSSWLRHEAEKQSHMLSYRWFLSLCRAVVWACIAEKIYIRPNSSRGWTCVCGFKKRKMFVQR